MVSRSKLIMGYTCPTVAIFKKFGNSLIRIWIRKTNEFMLTLRIPALNPGSNWSLVTRFGIVIKQQDNVTTTNCFFKFIFYCFSSDIMLYKLLIFGTYLMDAPDIYCKYHNYLAFKRNRHCRRIYLLLAPSLTRDKYWTCLFNPVTCQMSDPAIDYTEPIDHRLCLREKPSRLQQWVFGLLLVFNSSISVPEMFEPFEYCAFA